MTSTREALREHDWADFRPTRRLGDSEWHMWGVGLLRSAGFPASGLDLLGGPAAAAAADRGDQDAFTVAYLADSAAETHRLAALAGDEKVRTAIAWQNRTVYRVLDALAAGTGKESKRKQRERTLAMYWLRYCAKAETIGFFGPAAWMSVGRAPGGLAVDHGERLVARSRTYFERWALAAVADWMTAQPGARWWFPPLPRPDVHLDGDRLLLPGGRVTRLRPEDRQVLGHADGERNGAAIVEALVREDGWDTEGARPRVEKILTRLLKQRVLTWDANIPVDVRAERVLRRRVAAVADPELFVRFETVLTGLDRHRDAIDAATDPDQLAARLDELDAYFVKITGLDASRDEGKAYAGRTLCYQDAVRDCQVEVGTGFLDGIARPLALVADAADWFGNRLVELVEAEVAGFVRAAAPRRSPVTLADVWTQVLGLFWGGEGARPVHTATRELARKWREVLDLDPAGVQPVALRVDDIERRARAVFATGPVRSPHLALHSPDLQVVQEADGDPTVVLGELHACLATCDLPFLDWTSDAGSLRDKVNAAIGAPRLVPLLPVDWKRNSGRMVPAPIGAGDRLIGFTRAPFDDRSRIDPATAITLSERDGTVTATTPDGRGWSMAELLAVPVSIIAADAFKIGLDRPHAPRVSLDGLVLFRETWRVPAGEIPLAVKPDRAGDYLAVRRWLRASGLPDQAFVKFPQETKPSLVDFTSPTLVLSFANLVRRTRRLDADATVILSEPLPHPRDSWLTGADGERYVSELRLQISRKVPE
ncbi:lantibiotic dehydratase [Streptomyces sp. NBC_00102]|uniref:lantibiotic dehydratase n=1 Tax=Streptomyces sp. NBC_00102 TaxID=2975652 RepID=UPI0022516D78|nr:lantibiotic dehydratase [Streptomyces sp. NBC_00102]MCX5398106.1 lantibiotic dehydratase family protein [Streptomyces sp. NBC_00102]